MYRSLSILLFIATTIHTFRIGSFNLKQFGATKAKNEWVKTITAKILYDFDVVVIQEFSGIAPIGPEALAGELESISNNSYVWKWSEPMGRSTSKERYAFAYRNSSSGVKIINAYEYNDTSNLFERPPYIATFQVLKPKFSDVRLFTIINVHLRPNSSYDESIALRCVIGQLISKHPGYFNDAPNASAQNVLNPTPENKPRLNTSHPIVLMGDFNADCDYMSLKKQETLRNIYYPDFTWLINNQVKTNVAYTCTYDRILINGNNFIRAVKPNSNTTVLFNQTYNLAKDETLKISDHYPVKFDIEW